LSDQNLGAKFGILGLPWSTAPKRGGFVCTTNMYHRAKFNANWCHRRRDIYNRRERTEKQQT